MEDFQNRIILAGAKKNTPAFAPGVFYGANLLRRKNGLSIFANLHRPVQICTHTYIRATHSHTYHISVQIQQSIEFRNGLSKILFFMEDEGAPEAPECPITLAFARDAKIA